MEGPRRSPRTIWIAAGLLVLGLVVLVLGPLSSLGTNNRTEALFTESPDAASLTALGSFTDAAPGDTREGAAALETDTAALLASATSGVQRDGVATSGASTPAGSTPGTGAPETDSPETGTGGGGDGSRDRRPGRKHGLRRSYYRRQRLQLQYRGHF